MRIFIEFHLLNDLTAARICGGQTSEMTVKVLDEASKIAKKAGDSFVPVERLLTVLAVVRSKAKDALEAGAVNAQAMNAAINDAIDNEIDEEIDGTFDDNIDLKADNTKVCPGRTDLAKDNPIQYGRNQHQTQLCDGRCKGSPGLGNAWLDVQLDRFLDESLRDARRVVYESWSRHEGRSAKRLRRDPG